MQSPLSMVRRKDGAKALIMFITALLLAISLGQAAFGAPDVTFGDVNDDGKIDVRDVVLVMQYILELKELDDDQIKAADVTGDGEIDVNDVSQIMQYSLGLIDRFTVHSAIKSVERVEIDVSYGTAQGDIGLPEEVEITLYDNSSQDVSVKWNDKSIPEFQQFRYGHYVFRGELDQLPQNVFNPKELNAIAVVGVGYQVRPPRPAPPPLPDPPPVNTFADLGGVITQIVPGVYNLEIPFANAEESLENVTKDSLLVLYIMNKDPIVLSYNETRDAFFKAAVQGYTQQEINQALVYVWEDDDEPLTADDLNVQLVDIVPGVFNVIITMDDAQAELIVTETSTLVLKVAGKDPLTLEYSAVRDAFFKAAVQGYTENEIRSALIEVE